ncbi:hypothetical protein DY000_02044650 [Brassica cretica]|uniref:C2 domain-containing protein n=1 Tax=Brassica cretica TaxID=69181 RepID=A0ABQ7F467_BRACR|nr:hypothetical protein DY000_02044650 [Brassica cretica]
MAASSEPLDLVVTVVSAKHLKNVNWRNGDLKPYVVLYLDSDHRVSTRSDDSAKPVWNERITLPLTRSVHESVLNVEILHSDAAKTLVGSVRFPLVRLIDSEGAMVPESISSLELLRPSGRTQGKIRLKLAIKERPIPPPQRPQSQPRDYYSAPQGNHYYSPSPPPAPITSPYREFSPSPSPSPYPFTDHYYSGFYYPPPPPRSMYDRASNYGQPPAPVDLPLAPPRFPQPNGPSAPVEAFQMNEYKPQVGSRLSSYGVPSGPSAPVDYSPYDHRQLQKTMGGLSLEEERGAAERSESDFGARPPSYSYGREYRREYMICPYMYVLFAKLISFASFSLFMHVSEEQESLNYEPCSDYGSVPCLRHEPFYVLQFYRIFLQVGEGLLLCPAVLQNLFAATGTKRISTSTRPVPRDASVNQSAIKGPHGGKIPGCTTSCRLRLPRKTEVTAARMIKQLGCKFAKGLRLVVMRKKRKSSPSKGSSSFSSGRSQPSIMPLSNESHRSEAIEDCIEFINSSSSFNRSNSTC